MDEARRAADFGSDTPVGVLPAATRLAGPRGWLMAAMLAFAGWASGIPASGQAVAQEAPAATAAWLQQARVAGAKLPADMSAAAIERNLAALAAQNVSVV